VVDSDAVCGDLPVFRADQARLEQRYNGVMQENKQNIKTML